jgi:micrococcal nuclease
MGRFLRRLSSWSASPARSAGIVLALSTVLAGVLATNACTAAGAAGEEGVVVRVVDGDTLVVRVTGREERVRLIGVDTPESVHPRKPVEYFAKEASAFTKRMATGKRVRLEAEPANSDRDRYGRLLRYVFLPDGTLLNAAIIEQGYGHAYTRYPFARMEAFRALERQAREKERGLWAPGSAPNGTVPLAAASVAASPADADPGSDGSDGSEGQPSIGAGVDRADGTPGTVVYLTRTGLRYHLDGCRFLARSRIPVKLGEVEPRYLPCSVCRPPRLSPRRGETGHADRDKRPD